MKYIRPISRPQSDVKTASLIADGNTLLREGKIAQAAEYFKKAQTLSNGTNYRATYNYATALQLQVICITKQSNL